LFIAPLLRDRAMSVASRYLWRSWHLRLLRRVSTLIADRADEAGRCGGSRRSRQLVSLWRVESLRERSGGIGPPDG
jgi:hypothetical protein